MIQPLRTVHRRAFVGLAIVLPVIVAVGLRTRRPSAPAGERKTGVTFAALPKTSGRVWAKHAIRTQMYAEPSGVYITLQPEQDLNEPDLLLYQSDTTARNNQLPGDAQLLGRVVAGRPLRLAAGSDQRGQLILYSLAHHEVVDTAALEKMQ